ncbi:uncharacterized protein E0L32_005651 [Thyridium curvatum]|uniref:Extracellular membrane protein CFEM domain-containing protein n=1 Tax=Thyridium curvatum TaxID=1093900 RepID=A0A507BA61_9PEZI|nr:uncharacterized protein E0L32_005651 [Thyridium curvatum]TPX13951.1 hypothetical protein E0L32_005651 [Thyridium curvatum]
MKTAQLWPVVLTGLFTQTVAIADDAVDNLIACLPRISQETACADISCICQDQSHTESLLRCLQRVSGDLISAMQQTASVCANGSPISWPERTQSRYQGLRGTDPSLMLDDTGPIHLVFDININQDRRILGGASAGNDAPREVLDWKPVHTQAWNHEDGQGTHSSSVSPKVRLTDALGQTTSANARVAVDMDAVDTIREAGGERENATHIKPITVQTIPDATNPRSSSDLSALEGYNSADPQLLPPEAVKHDGLELLDTERGATDVAAPDFSEDEAGEDLDVVTLISTIFSASTTRPNTFWPTSAASGMHNSALATTITGIDISQSDIVGSPHVLTTFPTPVPPSLSSEYTLPEVGSSQRTSPESFGIETSTTTNSGDEDGPGEQNTPLSESPLTVNDTSTYSPTSAPGAIPDTFATVISAHTAGPYNYSSLIAASLATDDDGSPEPVFFEHTEVTSTTCTQTVIITVPAPTPIPSSSCDGDTGPSGGHQNSLGGTEAPFPNSHSCTTTTNPNQTPPTPGVPLFPTGATVAPLDTPSGSRSWLPLTLSFLSSPPDSFPAKVSTGTVPVPQLGSQGPDSPDGVPPAGSLTRPTPAIPPVFPTGSIPPVPLTNGPSTGPSVPFQPPSVTPSEPLSGFGRTQTMGPLPMMSPPGSVSPASFISPTPNAMLSSRLPVPVPPRPNVLPLDNTLPSPPPTISPGTVNEFPPPGGGTQTLPPTSLGPGSITVPTLPGGGSLPPPPSNPTPPRAISAQAPIQPPRPSVGSTNPTPSSPGNIISFAPQQGSQANPAPGPSPTTFWTSLTTPGLPQISPPALPSTIVPPVASPPPHTWPQGPPGVATTTPDAPRGPPGTVSPITVMLPSSPGLTSIPITIQGQAPQAPRPPRPSPSGGLTDSVPGGSSAEISIFTTSTQPLTDPQAPSLANGTASGPPRPTGSTGPSRPTAITYTPSPLVSANPVPAVGPPPGVATISGPWLPGVPATSNTNPFTTMSSTIGSNGTVPGETLPPPATVINQASRDEGPSAVAVGCAIVIFLGFNL